VAREGGTLEEQTMNESLLSLKTDEQLLAAVRVAGNRRMTPDEMLEQRVSFVYGSMDAKSAVTRERVRQMLLDAQGNTTSTAQ
jgi:SpoU rRNA methylase family enzyme